MSKAQNGVAHAEVDLAGMAVLMFDADPAELGRRFQQEAAVRAMRYVGDTLNQDMARAR